MSKGATRATAQNERFGVLGQNNEVLMRRLKLDRRPSWNFTPAVAMPEASTNVGIWNEGCLETHVCHIFLKSVIFYRSNGTSYIRI